MRLARLLVAASASLVLLAGCGGGDDDSSDSTGDAGAPSPSPTVSADPKALNACRTAMISALSAAYDASRKAPAADRDAVFVEKAGKLPEECRLIDTENLKRLRDEATEIAIPDGG